MTLHAKAQPLAVVSPELERTLTHGGAQAKLPPPLSESEIRREAVMVTMRDGVRLATDLYLPPALPVPVIAMRTPYGRGKLASTFIALARHGYAVISQDCRGTGDSEPDHWDFSMYEWEDGLDFVTWIVQQEWCDGFVGSCGGSYAGATQWSMAAHPRMSAIAPEVSSLLLTPSDEPRSHMFQNAYSRSVGKGAGKVSTHYSRLEAEMHEETLAGGYFNDPLHTPFRDSLLTRFPQLRTLPHEEGRRWLREHYRTLGPAHRAELIKLASGEKSVTALSVEALPSIFGHDIPVGLHVRPSASASELIRSLHAPPLIVTGWYDWGLREALDTWQRLIRESRECVRSRARLIISPSAHNVPGYHEGQADRPELRRNFRTENNVELLLRWYEAVREGATDDWPAVIYYLMGANEWCAAEHWPIPTAQQTPLYLGGGGTLRTKPPEDSSPPDSYIYDPRDPTPTVGGSIVSYVYAPGSADASKVQQRADVLVQTTAPLTEDVDVVGPLRAVLYASSSARDTDFAVRLSDVFPDGRAIQLQNGILRTRYRNLDVGPSHLEPGRVYRLEIDMWATANRFKAGHRIRLDISSADFPRFERNTNRGGEGGPPVTARQTVYHDTERPSHLLVSTLSSHPIHM